MKPHSLLACALPLLLAGCLAWKKGDLAWQPPLEPLPDAHARPVLGYQMKVVSEGRELDLPGLRDRRPTAALSPVARDFEEEVKDTRWFSRVERDCTDRYVQVDLRFTFDTDEKSWLLICNLFTLSLIPYWGDETWVLQATVRDSHGREKNYRFDDVVVGFNWLLALPLAPFNRADLLADRMIRNLDRHLLAAMRADGWLETSIAQE
jgi:hypothetical protein